MLKKLFSKIFKRRKPQSIESSQSTTKKKIAKPSETNILLKEAAKIKSSDINKAIELIKHVIELTPVNNKQLYFKLATYLHLSGSIDGAYKIFDDLMADLKEENISDFNSDKAAIYEKICTMNYKTGRYQDYLICYFYWLYNHIVGMAFQGKAKELTKFLKVKNKLVLMAPVKVEGCFKKLNKTSIKELYNERVSEYLSGFSEELITICKNKSGSGEILDEKYDLFKKYNSGSEMKFSSELVSLLEE